jgi:tetratricopeptide (TPR) repeat protein
MISYYRNFACLIALYGVSGKLLLFPAMMKPLLITIPYFISFLPSRDQLRPPVNIPSVVSKLHPLPQEELLTAFNRGNSYLIGGMFEDALLEFNRAADVGPNTGDVFLSRGIVKEKLLKWEEAIVDYTHANEIYKQRPFSKDDHTVFSNIANAETGLGRWDAALKHFTYAAKLNPDFQAPQIGKALVLYQLGRGDEAMAYFRALVEKYPAFADGQAAYSVMQYKLGPASTGLAMANEHWEDAMEEDSRYADVSWVSEIRR